MSKDFVECRNGSFYLIGSRIPLAHVVREYQRGEPSEAIRLHYPALSLEQVYGAISFYLGRKSEVEGGHCGTQARRGLFHRCPSNAHQGPEYV